MNLKLVFLGLKIAIAGVILSIIETAYFGWNWHPITEAEKMWDTIILLICITGAVIADIGFISKRKNS